MTKKFHKCPQCDGHDEEPLTEEELKDIKKGLDDIKKGKYKTTKEMKKKYGI